LEDGTTDLLETPMVVGFTHNIDKKSYIKLSFHPAMKPYLLELQSRFLIYDIGNILRLPSPYSIRLYELAKQYVRIGKRTMLVDNLKTVLGLEEKYERYTHFKQKILNKAKVDIAKHTDLILDFKEIKTGRKVTKLEFIITAKGETNTSSVEPTPMPPVHDSSNELTKLFKELGVGSSTIKKWTAAYEPAYILERIKYLKAQDTSATPIKNKVAYLQSIMDKDITIEDTSIDKAAITKRVNGILFSNPAIENQIRAKHGEVSQTAMEQIVKKMFIVG